jgi:hypothetical protein
MMPVRRSKTLNPSGASASPRRGDLQLAGLPLKRTEQEPLMTFGLRIDHLGREATGYDRERGGEPPLSNQLVGRLER